MRTPKLFRRSLSRALQWRLLLLWWASLLLPGALAAHPVFHFLRRHLDHFAGPLDAAAFLELLRQTGEDGPSFALGVSGALLAVLFVSPFSAGAMVTAARHDEPLRIDQLLAGAGELYGRMLRTLLAGLIPLAIGGFVATFALGFASGVNTRATVESAALRAWVVGGVFAAVAMFLAHLVVDGARAQFAADPRRRSAAMAVWHSAKLLVRHPLKALGVGAIGTVAALGGAALLMTARTAVAQLALAWLLAQGAHLAIGWGRSARIFGLSELALADTAARLSAGKASDT